MTPPRYHSSWSISGPRFRGAEELSRGSPEGYGRGDEGRKGDVHGAGLHPLHLLGVHAHPLGELLLGPTVVLAVLPDLRCECLPGLSVRGSHSGAIQNLGSAVRVAGAGRHLPRLG